MRAVWARTAKVARVHARAVRATARAVHRGGSMQCIGTHLVLRRDRVGADVRVPVGRQLADHRCEQEGRTSGQLTQLHLASTRGRRRFAGRRAARVRKHRGRRSQRTRAWPACRA